MEKTEARYPATPPGKTSENGVSSPRTGRPRPRRRQSVALFLLLSAFWLLLSGRIGLQYFAFMLGAVGLVMWMNPERPFRGASEQFEGTGLLGRLRAVKYLLLYVTWLVWNVIKANVEVARVILHPRLPIRPKLLVFRTTLEHDLARVLVANSITLTPGTVTIDLVGDEYLVHALLPESAGAVTGGILQNVVAPIFGEPPDPVPETTWSASYRELGK